MELGTDVKVIAGAGDNAAAAVGTGTVGDGQCNISLGTSGTIFISSKTFGVDEYNALHSFAHADGNYHLMGCMLSAASCNKWWMDEILKTKEYAKEQEAIVKLGENQVFYLPYLMGERSPHNDPSARAAFIGMSMDTTQRRDDTGSAGRRCVCDFVILWRWQKILEFRLNARKYAEAEQRVRSGKRSLQM